MKTIISKKYIFIGLFCLTIILLISIFFVKTKEGFYWDNQTKTNFLNVQRSINRNKIFDVESIQKQASEKEVDYLLKNNKWPWTKTTEKLYEESISNNPFIQNNSKDSLLNARKVYNNKVMLDILADQTKEGRFLSTGVEINTGKNMVSDGVGNFGYNSGLITNLYNPLIKCHPKTPNSDYYVLKSEEYIGDDGITGEHTIVTKDVDINHLEEIIPGFTFLDKPCNPCSALAYNNDPKYDCPFSLNVKNTNEGISNVWRYLWKLGGNYDKTTEVNANTFALPPFNK